MPPKRPEIEEKTAICVLKQGLCVSTTGVNGIRTLAVDGMGTCIWVAVRSTDKEKPFITALHADPLTDIEGFITHSVEHNVLGKSFEVLTGTKDEDSYLEGLYMSGINKALETLQVGSSHLKKTTQDHGVVIVDIDDGLIHGQNNYVYLGAHKDKHGNIIDEADKPGIELEYPTADISHHIANLVNCSIDDAMTRVTFFPVEVWRDGDVPGAEAAIKEQWDITNEKIQVAKDELAAKKLSPRPPPGRPPEKRDPRTQRLADRIKAEKKDQPKHR